MTTEKTIAVLARIKASIESHGFHVTVVQGGPEPRFAYTIGLHEKVGFEFVFAGGAFFTFDEVLSVVKEFARRSIAGEQPDSSLRDMDGLGRMTLGHAEPSWVSGMLLGALNYYQVERVSAFQILPDREHWTIDIPNMREPWSQLSEPTWKWLDASWDLPVTPRAKGITNLDALRGSPITEATRWEETEWELFAGAGPDVDENDLRIVPLWTLLAHDATLGCIVDLAVGSALWRESGGMPWRKWE